AVEILYVKGSGWDLATIEAAGFAPVRLEPMKKLARLETLSDPQMVNALKTEMTLAGAPSPSVETILHAVLPYRFVDHTHADAVVTLTNTADGERRIRELYGDRVIIVPYVMPGFDLARTVGELYQREATEETIGMILLNHGVFSFSDSAERSYERMIELVAMAEQSLMEQGAWEVEQEAIAAPQTPQRESLALLRSELSAAAGRPMVVEMTESVAGFNFVQHPELESIARRGPVTPDHVLRTKRIPMVGRNVAGYLLDYQNYFNSHAPNATEEKSMLDPAPRVVLDRQLGFCAVGKSPAEVSIVSDLYEQTMTCIQRAEQLGGWQALPAADIFDLEYWDLEQAKLKKGGSAPLFQGEVVLITGAASGIGKACVDSFLQRGAAVVGFDINPQIEQLYDNPAFLGICGNIADESRQQQALEQAVRRFGGVDMVVLNAGMFPSGTSIAELESQEWRQVLGINLDSNLALLRESYPLLKQAPNGGRVVVMGSKNVPAPGAGAAAYSASKAALTQLMRIAALEWGADGIRLNALHPDAVFDTGIWTEEVLQARADHYGMSVAEYKSRNVLGVEVSSHDVAELTAEMCGPLFA
ncbi:MAG: bifunctional aldolase/short-chain dehydrogenase, partial [Gammaproteobacteria bacterium]|nr:bifunctional aldolase/short-chain dehydrogenase [Gammaproteobacteria bacterium]